MQKLLILHCILVLRALVAQNPHQKDQWRNDNGLNQVRGGSKRVDISQEGYMTLPELPSRRKHPEDSFSNTNKDTLVILQDETVYLPPKAEKPGIPLPLGTSSMLISVLNLTKNIIGGGMLALPAGMAAGGGTGVGAACSLLVFTAGLAGYTYYTIGKSCDRTNATSFKALWTATLGAKSAWMIDTIIFSMLSGLLVLFLCFCGDLFSSLATSVPSLTVGKSEVILTIVMSTLLPLCLMKDLSALRYSSMLGLFSVGYIVFFIIKRAMDGSYQEGGEFFGSLAQHLRKDQTIMASKWLQLSLGSLVLLNCQTTSFAVHTNAVRFYNDLKFRSPSRFAKVILTAFGISAFVYALVMVMAFRTFGKNCQGLILNNYHLEDRLAQVCRLATGISLLTSFPLLFSAFRDSFVSILGNFVRKSSLSSLKHEDRPLTAQNLPPLAWMMTTVGLLGTVTCASLVVNDITLLVSLIGSIGGGLTTFIFPASMYRSLVRRERKMGGSNKFWSLQSTHLIMLAGLCLLAGGTYVSLA